MQLALYDLLLKDNGHKMEKWVILHCSEKREQTMKEIHFTRDELDDALKIVAANKEKINKKIKEIVENEK